MSVGRRSAGNVWDGFCGDLNDVRLERLLQGSGLSDLHGSQGLVGSEGQRLIGIPVTGTVGGGGLRRGLGISPQSPGSLEG